MVPLPGEEALPGAPLWLYLVFLGPHTRTCAVAMTVCLPQSLMLALAAISLGH